MSTSRHPIALGVERRVGGATKLLATVMCLPLIDGIFPALVLAGALDDPLGVAEVGLVVFGGSATVAVILADMDGTRREKVRAVLGVGAVLVAVAVVEAALAPTLGSLLDLAVFERFAGLVLLTVAAKTASARIGEYLPRPAVVVALGLLASVDPAGARVAVAADPGLMARAGAAALVGTGFALAVALLSPWLRRSVDIDRFRFGSAVALGVLPLGLFGLVPGDAPLALAVLGVSMVLALDPGRAPDAGADPAGARPGPVEAAGPGDAAAGDDADANPAMATASEPDGGEEEPTESPGPSRPPWV